MFNVSPIAQTVDSTKRGYDGSPLPSSEAEWIQYAQKYKASGGNPPTAPSSSGEIFAKRTDTCGFPILIAKCAGKTVKLFDKNGIQGAQIDIPDGWKLEAAAFNNNQDPARNDSLLCIFHKIGAFETKENRAWTWKVPNQDKVWNAITEADVKATPLPWAKPPK